MPDCLDYASSTILPAVPPLDTVQSDLLRRLRRAAAGNAASPEGVTLLGVSRREVAATAVLTVAITWTTEVETRQGQEGVWSAIHCRNAAELDAALARDLDMETASLETAHRLAAVIGSPDGAFRDGDAPPTLPAIRGPYYVHEACRCCSGGGVCACTGPGCRGGKVACSRCGGVPSGEDGEDGRCEECWGRGVLRCASCDGGGVVGCADCAGVGNFTHIHRPRLCAKPQHGIVLPPDAPVSVRAFLEETGFARFTELAETQPWTLRHSGTQLVYERAGTLPLVTLSCRCDGVTFKVELVGPQAELHAMPVFLDSLLAPALSAMEAAPGPDAFAIASSIRLTGTIAGSILAGVQPDLEAIASDQEGCVSRVFLERAAAVLRRAHRAAGLGAARQAWQQAAAALALVPPLVAALDLPGLLTGATAGDPVALPLRLSWDLGIPLLAGGAAWLTVRDRVRRAMEAALGAPPVRPVAQGAWPWLVLGAASLMHLAVMTGWHGGLGVDRVGPGDPAGGSRSEAALDGGADRPLPPRALSPEERIAAGQRALARLGLYDGAIDGKPGERTRAGLAGLAGFTDAAPGEPFEALLDRAVAIASDREAVRLSTPDLLVGPGWSNATRLRIAPQDYQRIAAVFRNALAAPGNAKEWLSEDGTRSGLLTVTGPAADPRGRSRPCFAFAHTVTTPAGRDGGVPSRACLTDEVWELVE